MMTTDVLTPAIMMMTDVWTPAIMMTTDFLTPAIMMTTDFLTPAIMMTSDVLTPAIMMTTDFLTPAIMMTTYILTPTIMMRTALTCQPEGGGLHEYDAAGVKNTRHLVHLFPVHSDLLVLEQPHRLASVLEAQTFEAGGRGVLKAIATAQPGDLW
jgi:hypothetical protein